MYRVSIYHITRTGKNIITFITNNFPNNNTRISAQLYLQKFYEKHGFKAISESYLEDDIPHIAMVREHIL